MSYSELKYTGCFRLFGARLEKSIKVLCSIFFCEANSNFRFISFKKGLL